MADTSGMGLREPEQMDWDKFNTAGGKYQAPPEPFTADGKTKNVFTAQLPKDLGSEERRLQTQEGYRKFEVGPLTLAKNGNGIDGQQIRYYSVSVKKFRSRKTGEPMDLSQAALLLKGAGVAQKPQTNADYEKAIAQASGRTVQITLDWVARNKDTGEKVEGAHLFPIDPETGRRKAILSKGDKLTDGTVVTSEVLFANAVVDRIITK